MIKIGKTCKEKNRITDRHIKRHDSTEKLKPKIKHSWVALTTQKSVAGYFKDVKTEETFSSQPRPEASGNYQFVITFLRQNTPAQIR